MSEYVYEVHSDVPLALVTGIGNIIQVVPVAMYSPMAYCALTVRDKVITGQSGPQASPARLSLELKAPRAVTERGGE